MGKMITPPLGPEAPITRDDRARAEVKELSRSIGELRMGMDALKRELVNVVARLAELEQPKATGSIQGLAGEWTVTPPPEWG